MKHNLIAKYEALWYMANIHRSMQHDKSTARKMTHKHYQVEEVYGISFNDSSVLTMYCYVRKKELVDPIYIRAPLSDFSKDDQIYQIEVNKNYIALTKELKKLENYIKSVFVGKTVVQLFQEKEVIIDDVNFDCGISFVIKNNTLSNVIPHTYFK